MLHAERLRRLAMCTGYTLSDFIMCSAMRVIDRQPLLLNLWTTANFDCIVVGKSG